MKQIAIAIVRHHGKYLVGQRPVGVALAGLFEFPGGKIEAGETSSEAAVRECREEAGIEVSAEELLLRHREVYPHGEVQLDFWDCIPREKSEELPVNTPFYWALASELCELEFPEGNREILALIHEREGLE